MSPITTRRSLESSASCHESFSYAVSLLPNIILSYRFSRDQAPFEPDPGIHEWLSFNAFLELKSTDKFLMVSPDGS